MSNYDCNFRIPRSMTRRDALRTGLMAAGFLALGPFGKRNSEALGAPRQAFKRLVVVNCVGGLDTLNVVIPDGLSAYAQKRQSLAIPTASSLALNNTSLYRLHPSMPRFAGLWNDGDAAAIQRVGYPQEDLSHFVSADVFSYGVRNSFTSLRINKSGWIARYADQAAATPFGAVAIGMGRPLDFTGGIAHGLAVNTLSAFQLNGALSHPTRMETAKSIIKNAPTTGLTYEAQQGLAGAYDLVDQVQQALVNHNTYLQGAPIAWPATTIGNRLKDIAALIHGGFDTRVFYTGFGQFDTHGGQGTTGNSGAHPIQLKQLDDAVGAFVDEMKAFGIWDDIVMVFITEFGRRTLTFGGGTDHGHAFAELVIGGAVKGGQSYGDDLTNTDLNEPSGYLSYSTDFRNVYKEIVHDHLGADADAIFPEFMPKDRVVDFM